ncbi:thiamine pyrophosphate-binding protein [Mycolicibacterium komossense]|uniref:acetolactate synthase n=1 Tax=Mycolicibacterium komossense TaxID=1779 RepID=A0ABT3CJ43_9MYCO|nr:thiamine pyrophosphate-dependent enzyme [Mycolicibacterium komossense]MCV7229377.1 thiamine pyrophosphate-binding protein [Mycolicibacterium komossense]
MAKPYRVVDYIVDYLECAGVGHIFGVDGANIEDLYDAAYFNPGVTAVLAKHEFSAATMADGYSRAGIAAGFGVVVATSGGGSLNLVPGLGESLASRIPVLALVGQPPSTMDGGGSFQDTSGRNGSLDAQKLFSAVSVFCQRITEPADIVTALPAAVSAALTGGPAVLLLPKNSQQSLLDPVGVSALSTTPKGAEPDDIHFLARSLSLVRERVTIIAGEQVALDNARAELEELRALLQARVATVPEAKDVSTAALGVTGVMGHPGVAVAVTQSAVCLLVGTRLSLTARSGLEAALGSVRTVSVGSAQPFVPCAHVHSDDLRISLAELSRALSSQGSPAAPRSVDSTPRAALTTPPFHGPGIDYRSAIAALDSALPDGTDIIVDAGNTGAAAVHHLPVRHDGRFVVALGMGGMGYSFGAGIGMAFARGRRTVVIAGDGAFFMHGMEVHTAVQYGLPVTFVLFNNNAHAMCVAREKLFYDDLYSYNRFTASRLGAGLSAMFPGLLTVDVDVATDLPGALRRALAADGPSVVSIECSADEIPPFAAFLKETHNHVTART